MGQEIVLHATANGKAWLSTLQESDALRIVCARGFVARRPLGPNSATNVDEFRAMLAETRERGFATSVEEAEEGTGAVSVPFFDSPDQNGKVAGTLSVAGPLTRINAKRYEELSQALHVAASELSQIWALRSRQRNYVPAEKPVSDARKVEA